MDWGVQPLQQPRVVATIAPCANGFLRPFPERSSTRAREVTSGAWAEEEEEGAGRAAGAGEAGEVERGAPSKESPWRGLS